jgi:hypothetical protein
MFNDPQAIADKLIEEHGIDGAIDMAVGETQSAHSAGDNYMVSVWCEIKRELRERKTK